VTGSWPFEWGKYMLLKEFVSETLKQITDGVRDAQQAVSSGAVIAPFYRCVEKVDFDVAVTAVEKTEKEGKAGINVWSVGAGVRSEAEASTSTSNRIKFSVSIQLPKGSNPSRHQDEMVDND